VIRLTIDNLEVEVVEGTKVIDAAQKLGIMIPRFCYHEALGSVGACRLCAVKFVEGPLKGLEMSCMVDAEDGMVISTTDREAVDFRRYIIECLMLHHPHDCPVCDEGGHCLLQDETVSGGHGIRRYLGRKRTYRDQHLGPFVQHEMNRCIHCFRCRRFYQEFSGYRDLGAMQIGSRMYFGRFENGPLESPFAGNLIDICPTGVFTDRAARYKVRRWDLERSPSICLHCSLGCHTIACARYREVVRQEAGLSREVNGHFICDRGRFGFDYANHPDRPRTPKLYNREASWQEALQGAAEVLGRIASEAGPGAVACLGSVRSSLETQSMLVRVCRGLGWPAPVFFIDPETGSKVRAAVSRLDTPHAISMREMEHADFILGVGVDPVNEAPMLAMAMRQANRRGATVGILDPRPVCLPFDFRHVSVRSGELERCLSILLKRGVARAEAESLGTDGLRFYDHLAGGPHPESRVDEVISLLALRIKESQRPVIVCGTDIVPPSIPHLAADCLVFLKRLKEGAGLFYVLPGPNAFGTAMLQEAVGEASPLIVAIEKGEVKALVLVENDPFHAFPDRERLREAMSRLDLLVVLDYLPTPSAARAHVLLPTLSVFERQSGSFVNQEGRLQVARPVHFGGTPIHQISKGGHPPRIFLDRVPGGDMKGAGEVLEELAKMLPPSPGLDLSGDPLGFIEPFRGSHDGPLRLLPHQSAVEPFSRNYRFESGEEAFRGRMELIVVDWTFGTEELSRYSTHTMKAEMPPRVLMNKSDAARVGLSDGDRVEIRLPRGGVSAELETNDRVAPGVIVVPRHRLLDWQHLDGLRMQISEDWIRKG
jgi:NADH-quinone oxidoreductase subunit G